MGYQIYCAFEASNQREICLARLAASSIETYPSGFPAAKLIWQRCTDYAFAGTSVCSFDQVHSISSTVSEVRTWTEMVDGACSEIPAGAVSQMVPDS